MRPYCMGQNDVINDWNEAEKLFNIIIEKHREVKFNCPAQMVSLKIHLFSLNNSFLILIN
jgi:hypothetical protein